MILLYPLLWRVLQNSDIIGCCYSTISALSDVSASSRLLYVYASISIGNRTNVSKINDLLQDVGY